MYHVQLQKHRQHHDFSESSSSPVPEPPEWIRPPGLSHWSTNSRETACPSALRHPKLQAKKEASMKFHLEMPELHVAIAAPMLAFCPATASVGRAPQIVSVRTYNETSHLWLSELRSSALRCLWMPWARNVRRPAVWLEWAYRFSPSHQVHARRFEQSCPEHVKAFQGWKGYGESRHFSKHSKHHQEPFVAPTCEVPQTSTTN